MAEATVVALILAITIAIGIITSVPIAVSIGVASLLAGVAVLGPSDAGEVLAGRTFTAMNSFTLLAIPLFVLAGVLMANGGIAGRLIDAAKVVVGRAPSSLGATTIAANGMFGAVSGAAVAAAAAVGSVTVPRMKEEGYNPRLAAAVNVVSAPAGMLIPPSNTFIVYSLVGSTSVAALFMAGVVPGIIWVVACIITLMIVNRGYKGIRAELTFKKALRVLWRAVPSLAMVVVVVGGILAGFFTATESAAIAVAYCLVLALAYGNVGVSDLPRILLDAGRTTSVVMILVGVSGALAWILSYARIPQLVSDAMLGISENQYIIMLLILLMMLLVGTFMDPTPAILIFVPIFLPIISDFGIHPVQFGAIVVMAMAIGSITPPVGNVLFIGARIASEPVEQVARKALPFYGALILALVAVAFIPALSMWLPTVAGLVAP
ncbi:TRAP transporter large permease [Demequina aurantiaca]|uniref:TRAP transporter large permease n=1 Tax=Demequina aurantiaca TaxID=676200 RepID=UPI003D33773C